MKRLNETRMIMMCLGVFMAMPACPGRAGAGFVFGEVVNRGPMSIRVPASTG